MPEHTFYSKSVDQLLLLGSPEEPTGDVEISGLKLIRNYVSESEAAALLSEIDSHESAWLHELSRRVQHYGFKYDYRARALTESDRIGPIPDWIGKLGARMTEDGLFGRYPDQVIINEYLPGQGIAAHADRETCFGSVVSSLSLGSDVIMEFTQANSGERLSLLLPKLSLLVMTGEARYLWKHAIPQRTKDRVAGRTIHRQRRVSLTFRTVLGVGERL
jgi:alkylated DNA repair dioxygenase AlkB